MFCRPVSKITTLSSSSVPFLKYMSPCCSSSVTYSSSQDSMFLQSCLFFRIGNKFPILGTAHSPVQSRTFPVPPSPDFFEQRLVALTKWKKLLCTEQSAIQQNELPSELKLSLQLSSAKVKSYKSVYFLWLAFIPVSTIKANFLAKTSAAVCLNVYIPFLRDFNND